MSEGTREAGSCCKTCDRPLNQDDDALSGDCGGDCWGCVGEAEAKMGYGPSIAYYNKEVRQGLRPGPVIEVDGDGKSGEA